MMTYCDQIPIGNVLPFNAIHEQISALAWNHVNSDHKMCNSSINIHKTNTYAFTNEKLGS